MWCSHIMSCRPPCGPLLWCIIPPIGRMAVTFIMAGLSGCSGECTTKATCQCRLQGLTRRIRSRTTEANKSARRAHPKVAMHSAARLDPAEQLDDGAHATSL